MKKTLICLASLFIFYSCKKENDPGSNNNQPRLNKIQYAVGTPDDQGYVFSYNSNGRISDYSYYWNAEPPVPVSSISYSGNEIILTRNETTIQGTNNTEIRLTVDNQGRLLKRIQRTVQDYPGAYVPQKHYINDTLNYEYDAQGLLKQTSGGLFDSLWYNPADLEIQSTHTQRVTHYTVSNGNLSTSLEIGNVTGTSLFNGVLNVFARSVERTTTYDYSNLYANKSDFSNAALLNEIGFAPYFLNKGSKNMPNKISILTVNKDKDGNITTTSNNVRNILLEFDSKGNLSKLTPNTSEPNIKYVLIYQ